VIRVNRLRWQGLVGCLFNKPLFSTNDLLIIGWCGPLTVCHVACVGPTCQTSLYCVGPTCADVVQWMAAMCTAGVWLSTDVGCCGCAMWHQLSEVAFYGCAMWHRLGWGGPLVDCHLALRWGLPVRWLVPGWGPLADVDQWEGAMWHRLGAPLAPQIIPRMCSVSKLYPERPWSNLSPLIYLFNLFYLLWIYSDSSTCPKIIRFSPKISKFMMITPVILNSHFCPCLLVSKILLSRKPCFLLWINPRFQL
jgi:hypothetical protein